MEMERNPSVTDDSGKELRFFFLFVILATVSVLGVTWLFGMVMSWLFG